MNAVIKDETSVGMKQSWQRSVTAIVEGHKVKVTIHRDFYDFQTRISSHVWSEGALKWNVIETRLGEAYKSLAGSQVRDERMVIESSQPLVDNMLAYAEEILS